MANAEVKTKKTNASVKDFIDSIEDEKRRKESQRVLAVMKSATKAKPKLWGTSIVGFGDYHYKGASGREGDWFPVGFSPRKQQLVIYLMTGFTRYPAIMKRLGKHSTGKGCLYIKKLDDIDIQALEELVATAYIDLTGGKP